MPDQSFGGLPEVMASLRSFGSSRRTRHGGAEQPRLYAPLLDARRAAAAATSRTGVLAAFDSQRIARAVNEVVRGLAAERHPSRAPARRAFEAELADVLAPLITELSTLGSLAGSTDTDDGWRDWLAQLRRVFACADAAWPAVDRALAPPPGAPGGSHAPPRANVLLLLASSGAALAMLGAAPRAAAAQHATIAITGVSADTLRARGFDIVDRRGSDIVVVANERDRARIAAAGWRTRELLTPSRTRAPAVTTTTIYRPFDDPRRGVRVFLDSMARANPNVHVDSIGASYEGRPILAVKIGPPDDSPSRPNVLFMATYHAREWVATDVALRLIRTLATPADARVDSIIHTRDVWIIPVVNPDGYQYTFTTDRLWRKNRRPVGTDASGAPVYGVDLNRNHSIHWGFDNLGSSNDPQSEVYRGPAPVSEPETRAIEAFHRAHPPVTAVSYHTYAELALFPPGYDYGLLPGDLSIFRALGGDDLHPAIADHLPNSGRGYYRAVPAWNLYPTNGEYADFAYLSLGTIAFTVEMTSGVESGQYYGFEFPDDEARLETVFDDNLPFALDILESAGDPLHAAPRASGVPVEPLVVETTSPLARVRVPASETPRIAATSPLPIGSDTLGHGTFMRRWLSAPTNRAPQLTVQAGSLRGAYTVLAIGGAEPTDTAWHTSGFAPGQPGRVGQYDWRGTSGYVRSPVITVPTTYDSLSVLYWTQYNGNGFDVRPHGEVRMTTDGGATWRRVGFVAGSALAYYPERVVVTGMRGKTVQFEFSTPDGLAWQLDEITVVAHGAPVLAASDTARLLPSANPLRGDVVYFNWPFGATAGDLSAYDFAGHLAWRTAVSGGTKIVTWNVHDSAVANGAYLVLARAGGRTRQFKLFITRPR